LLGGFFVLYSTIFSGTAGTTRLYADALGVLKLVDFSDFQARLKWIRIFTVAVPAIQAIVFALNPKPHTMLTLGALANGMLAPVLAFGTIWLRRHGTDPRIAPSRLTDFFLWVCSGTVCAVSLGYVLLKLPELVGR